MLVSTSAPKITDSLMKETVSPQISEIQPFFFSWVDNWEKLSPFPDLMIAECLCSQTSNGSLVMTKNERIMAGINQLGFFSSKICVEKGMESGCKGSNRAAALFSVAICSPYPEFCTARGGILRKSSRWDNREEIS